MDIIASSYAAEHVGRGAGVNRMFSKRTVLNEAMICRYATIALSLLAPITTAAVPAHDELPEMRTLCLEWLDRHLVGTQRRCGPMGLQRLRR